MSEDLSKQRMTSKELSVSNEDLSIVFGYAAQKYATEKTGKHLSGIPFEAFKVLFKETHTTMREIEEHNRVLAGKGVGTLTRSISTLRDRGVPVQTEQVLDDKGVMPTHYTRYFLTAEFKAALYEEAMEWHASVEAAGLNADIPGVDRT